MDGFALASWKMLFLYLLYGGVSCFLAFGISRCASLSIRGFSLMPLLEELLKALLLIILVLQKKLQFMAEALIYGSATGGGFSLVENIIYLVFQPDMYIGTAVVRGFGCAILHMGCTALIVSLLLTATEKRISIGRIVMAVIPSIVIHFIYNSFLTDKVALRMVLCMCLFILLFLLLFSLGEKKIYRWMDHSISTDIQLLSAIRQGNFSTTKAGRYLLGVKEQFQPEAFFDIFCYVRIYLELKIQKQSDMLLSQAGYSAETAPEAERTAQKAELAALEKRIGRTGMWVLSPLIKDRI